MKWSAFHCTYARLLPVVLPPSFPFRNLCVCVCLNWHECLFLWVLACTLFVYVLLSFKCCVAWTFPGSMNTANFFLILSYYFVSFGTSVWHIINAKWLVRLKVSDEILFSDSIDHNVTERKCGVLCGLRHLFIIFI